MGGGGGGSGFGDGAGPNEADADGAGVTEPDEPEEPRAGCDLPEPCVGAGVDGGGLPRVVKPVLAPEVLRDSGGGAP